MTLGTLINHILIHDQQLRLVPRRNLPATTLQELHWSLTLQISVNFITPPYFIKSPYFIKPPVIREIWELVENRSIYSINTYS
jgi:hypothetical protein